MFTTQHEGRSLVMAPDRLSHSEWMLVLCFRVGDGLTDLVAHLIQTMPDDWRGLETVARKDWLMSLAALMSPWPPKGERVHLTTATVRAATTTQLDKSTRELIATGAGIWGGEVEAGVAHKSGPQRGDLHLALVARWYVELLQTSSTPKADLVKIKGASINGAPINTVNSWLYKARERGLLTSDGRGRAGGQLTIKAHRVLEGNQS